MLRKHFPANIRVNIMEDAYGDNVDIYILKYGANGVTKKVLQIRGDEEPAQRHFWADVEEATSLPSPTFRIRRSDWGLIELFKAMTEEHRNTPPDREAEFQAMHRHLMDMRSLLFEAIGAEDPHAPLVVKSGLPYEDMEILQRATGKIVIPDDIIIDEALSDTSTCASTSPV